MHCQSILKKCLLSVIFLTLWITLHSQPFTPELFREPTIGFWPRPLWFWNNTEVTVQGVTTLMEAMRDKCGYGGFGVVPFGKNFKPEYLSEDYLKVYGAMLAKAKELGMTISLYDEFGFPSGSVGAFTEGDDTPRFRQKYPDLTIQRLDKTEEMVKGPVAFSIKLPPGKFMGAAAISVEDKKRIDISGSIADGKLNWNVPAGRWKIMMFSCVIDGVPIADYLNPDAIKKFTGMVHDVYYSRFREYFGSVIYGTFYDEPSMFHADFRMWTPEFNEKFTRKYGFSPVTLYPALWYDIGQETGQARNLLFGFRAELYANGFNRVVNEWSLAHGITATGHTAPEEALVPANSAGDLMKSFKYLDIPGIDKIGGSRPAERFYKLVSSAAQNWDKRYVMSETYGAMPDYAKPGNLTWNQMDSIAIDQYTKGINMLIPHAVWYDNTRVTYKPELSHRNPLYADSLKYFTRFLSRLNVIMQAGGRHVADIAVLYPIDELLSEHWFYSESGPANIDGPVDPANMFYRKAVKDIDYINIGNWLLSPAGKDFTYLHPEVLNERCVVSDGLLKLKNEFNSENFRVVIVPSCRLISAAALSKLGRFCQDGGTLIFTTRIPEQSAEPGMDNRIDSLMNKVLPQGFRDGGRIYTNNSGGKACFLPHPDGPGLRKLLLSISGDYDVSYPELPGLQYIHKNLYGRNIYLFGNTRGSAIDTKVNLKGKLELELWDPQTGEITPAKTETVINNSSGEIYTSVRLSLHPYRACFLIEKGKIDHCK